MAHSYLCAQYIIATLEKASAIRRVWVVPPPPPSPSISNIETHLPSAANVSEHVHRSSAIRSESAFWEHLGAIVRTQCSTYPRLLTSHLFAPRATVANNGPYRSVKKNWVNSVPWKSLSFDRTLVQMVGKQFPNQKKIRSILSLPLVLTLAVPQMKKILTTLFPKSRLFSTCLVGCACYKAHPGAAWNPVMGPQGVMSVPHNVFLLFRLHIAWVSNVRGSACFQCFVQSNPVQVKL